jgi:hypothetical protein
MYDKAKQFTLTRPRLKKVVGYAFLVVGFIALVTPLTPGAALLLAIGCELVGLRLVFLDRFLKRSKKDKGAETEAPLVAATGTPALEA